MWTKLWTIFSSETKFLYVVFSSFLICCCLCCTCTWLSWNGVSKPSRQECTPYLPPSHPFPLYYFFGEAYASPILPLQLLQVSPNLLYSIAASNYSHKWLPKQVPKVHGLGNLKTFANKALHVQPWIQSDGGGLSDPEQHLHELFNSYVCDI